MSVTQYIGARYVPIFDGEWDITKTYEPLTVVQYQGNSYTSKQAVPAQIEITDTTYWANTGNYNAQVEAYRQEVRTYDGRINANADAIEAEAEARAQAIEAEETARTQADNALQADIDAAETELENCERVKNYIAIIGDSFSTSSSYPYWPQIVADKTKWNIINKAINGAGFVAGTPFIQQLQALIEDPNFDKVAHIIVYGGVNDYNVSRASIATMNDVIGQFYNAYLAIPKENRPELHLCFGNIGVATAEQYDGFFEWYKGIKQLCEADARPGIVDNVAYWHFNGPDYFNSDNLHPNALGQRIIAAYMMEILSGSYHGVHRYQFYNNLAYNGVHADGRVTLSFDNGQVNFSLRMAQPFSLTPQSNTFYDFGDVTGGANQYSIMIGSGAGAYPNPWMVSEPILIANTATATGELRAIFNCGNKHLYFQLFGDASGFSTLDIPGDLQLNMQSIPLSW